MDVKDAMERALGYFELGLLGEADALLENVVMKTPTVEYLHLCILVKMGQSKWEAAVQLASQAMEDFPKRSFGYIQKAYALHEMKQTAEAAAILGEAPLDPIEPVGDILAYNRACYCAQLGQNALAIELLQEAILLNESFLSDALEDPDFEPIREQVKALKP